VDIGVHAEARKEEAVVVARAEAEVLEVLVARPCRATDAQPDVLVFDQADVFERVEAAVEPFTRFCARIEP